MTTLAPLFVIGSSLHISFMNSLEFAYTRDSFIFIELKIYGNQRK